MENKEFVERMEIELKELEEKLEKLDKFMDSGEFQALSDLNQTLLFDQAESMADYAKILKRRIKLNK